MGFMSEFYPEHLPPGDAAVLEMILHWYLFTGKPGSWRCVPSEYKFGVGGVYYYSLAQSKVLHTSHNVDWELGTVLPNLSYAS